jgi:hypothetical protein
MKKIVKFPWDRVPDEIYHAELTDFEYDLIESTSDKVVKNIFRREKSPLKRAALIAEISRIANTTATNKSAHEESKRKIKYHKKAVTKLKKKSKKNKK